MLGGGTFIAQDKVLSGVYVKTTTNAMVNANVGTRGKVALLYALDNEERGECIFASNKNKLVVVTAEDYVKDTKSITGFEITNNKNKNLNDLFIYTGAIKGYIYPCDLDSDTESATHQAFLNAVEVKFAEINTLVCLSNNATIQALYVTFTKRMREEYGATFRLVVANYIDADTSKSKVDTEYVINVANKVAGGDDGLNLLYWVGGADSSCEFNASLLNKLYNGAYDIDTDYTQTELIALVNGGFFTFHDVEGETRVLNDINSLTSFTESHGEQLSLNQTMRTVDQISADARTIWNKQILGKYNNDQDGYDAVKAVFIAYMLSLQNDYRAIKNFDKDTDIIVSEGKQAGGVVLKLLVEPVTALSKLYIDLNVAL